MSRRPTVPTVRGPFLRLEPHEKHCVTTEKFVEYCAELRRNDPGSLLVADLFAGAGGMSLGLEQAGMHVVLGADHDADALETHRHHFGGMAIDWDLGDPANVRRVANLMKLGGVDVLAGGPPCQPFSKAGRSGMRFLVRAGLREAHDKRRDLWLSYLKVIELARPRAVIMENVPDMALDREMFILRSIVLKLEQMNYSVQERVVETWRYGVPQFRQRLILVAVAKGNGFTWPQPSPERVNVENAISDLPHVEDGDRPPGGAMGWWDYVQPKTSFQAAMRAGVAPEDRGKIFDHITRPVREDDRDAFARLDPGTRYSELPDHLKRYRDDIFDDKYKRLSEYDVSRTITAHIAKDGYWYIHPEQDRTITVREAARLQTFPDHFRFAGSPTSAFRQIGNAVPPRLAQAVGLAVVEGLGTQAVAPPSTEDVSARLRQWFASKGRRERLPWLRARTRWQVLIGDSILDRCSSRLAADNWPRLRESTTPAALLKNSEVFLEIASWLGKSEQAKKLILAAESMERPDRDPVDDELEDWVTHGFINRPTADLAMIAVPHDEEPVVVTAAALRVANRVNKNPLGKKNRNTDGRIAISRLVGYGEDSNRAHLGLIELGTTVCRVNHADCGACPLSGICQSAYQV